MVKDFWSVPKTIKKNWWYEQVEQVHVKELVTMVINIHQLY